MLAGVEAGGTKFVVGLGTGPGDIAERALIPTTTPDETLGRVIDWFAARPPARALGIASFGPVRIDRSAADWGTILATPKPGWSGAALGPRLQAALDVPARLATDVTAAAMAEARWGAARGARLAVYVTVGTGLGAGVVVDGVPLDRHGHSEMGHIRVLRAAGDDFPGRCPFHGDCLEGMACGPAIIERWGRPLSALGEGHCAYEVIGDYLGQFVNTLRATLAPDRIVLGGGVPNAPLVERVQARADALANGYFDGDGASLLRLSSLAGDSGLLGAFALAEAALRSHRADRGTPGDAR